MGGAARYVLLNSGHLDYDDAVAACTAAVGESWPGNVLGLRTNTVEGMALAKVPPGFVLGGATVLAIYDLPPREMLASENWAADPDDAGVDIGLEVRLDIGGLGL